MGWRAAVVTGGGSGLGRAIALELARRGTAVVVGDVSEAGALETVAQVRAAGGRAEAQVADVRDPASHEALRALAVERFGELDLWVNNAGVAVGGPIGQVPIADWEWVIAINLMGVVHGCQAAVPGFRAQGRGAILNVASAAGLLSSPELGPYNASKAAVVALTETLAAELAGSGVSATVLCPTFFQTDLLETARVVDPSKKRQVHRLMAASKMTAEDVARRALADAAAGRLYSVPMADGRWFWRLKRFSPEHFQALVAWVVPRIARRLR